MAPAEQAADLACTDRPSPNFGPRRGDAPIDMLLLHYTGMPDDEQALAWLCNPESEVSAHYFVHRDGRVDRLVGEDCRAWHAGAGRWAGETDINSRSLGIEIANPGHQVFDADPPAVELPPFPDAQIAALIALCRDICARHPIPPHRVLAHSDVAPSRKRDPGERFPWACLAGAGIGHFVEPALVSSGPCLKEGDAGAEVAGLQALLALYGYGVPDTGRYDRDTSDVVAAFQRHFRPARVDGVADPSTCATLSALLAALA